MKGEGGGEGLGLTLCFCGSDVSFHLGAKWYSVLIQLRLDLELMSSYNTKH